ncbi:MAG: S49 family peptidase [Pseudomonadota bacterium]
MGRSSASSYAPIVPPSLLIWPQPPYLPGMAFRLSSAIPFRKTKPLVSVVRLNGVIAASSRMRAGLNLTSVAPLLERAFAPKDQKAVALIVNSPGGSPVQSHLITQRVRQLADEKNIPVVVFAEDVAASGGYMLACAGDEIFCDQSSVLGSIGVISAGFGFKGLIEKIGVERRVHTAGESKSMLDPFKDEVPEDIDRLRTLQGEIHDHFKSLVRERRAGKLKAPEEELFTGAFWTGSEAVKLGLADGIDDVRSVMRRRYGDTVKLRVVAPPKSLSLFGSRISSDGSVPASFWPHTEGWAEEALGAIEQRTLWGRFGL